METCLSGHSVDMDDIDQETRASRFASIHLALQFACSKMEMLLQADSFHLLHRQEIKGLAHTDEDVLCN